MTDVVPSPDRLEVLAQELSDLDLTLAPDAVPLRERAIRLSGAYLAPRLRHLDGERVVVVVGATGVGKSTIVNALAQSEVAEVGDRRPTTMEPVVWCSDDLPPTLEAARRSLPGWKTRGRRSPPAGVAVIDTPPPDVLGPDGVPLAHAILGVADACVLVVSAARYADAVGLDLAERSRGRGLPTAVVVNRLPADEVTAAEIVGDVAAVFLGAGIVDSDSGQVHEVAEVGRGARVPASAVQDLWARVTDWGTAPQSPAIRGSVIALVEILDELRSVLLEAEARRLKLSSIVASAYEGEVEAFASEVAAGRFAGAADAEARAALVAAVTRHAGRAARRSADLWAAVVPDTVDAHPELYVAAEGTPDRARAAVDVWASAEGVIGRGRRLRRIWTRLALETEPGLRRRDRRLVRRRDLDGAARRGLIAAVGEVLARDADRFRSLLGSSVSPTLLRLLDGESLL